MDARPDLQKVLSSPEHVEEHDELETWESLGGYSSPHQQWVPSERPRTSLPRPRQICWHEPAVTKLPLPWSSRGVPVAKQPMVDISDAATVAVGVGMETILDDEVVSCADAMARKAAAATADSDLMEIMLCVCVCECGCVGWSGGRVQAGAFVGWLQGKTRLGGGRVAKEDSLSDALAMELFETLCVRALAGGIWGGPFWGREREARNVGAWPVGSTGKGSRWQRVWVDLDKERGLDGMGDGGGDGRLLTSLLGQWAGSRSGRGSEGGPPGRAVK